MSRALHVCTGCRGVFLLDAPVNTRTTWHGDDMRICGDYVPLAQELLAKPEEGVQSPGYWTTQEGTVRVAVTSPKEFQVMVKEGEHRAFAYLRRSEAASLARWLQERLDRA